MLRMSSTVLRTVLLVFCAVFWTSTCAWSEREVGDADEPSDAAIADGGAADGIVWVDPVTGECPEGLRPGGCGLRGRCIECVDYFECSGLETCNLFVGRCSSLVVSSTVERGNSAIRARQTRVKAAFEFESTPLCMHDYDCVPQEICVHSNKSMYECVRSCSSFADCLNGEYCATCGTVESCGGRSYCEKLVCPPEGECPEGFQESEGSGYCYYKGEAEQDAGVFDGSGD